MLELFLTEIVKIFQVVLFWLTVINLTPGSHKYLLPFTAAFYDWKTKGVETVNRQQAI